MSFPPNRTPTRLGKTLIKHGAVRKMSKTGSPKSLRDDCLEFESHFRSKTAHDIFAFNGQVPETIMSGGGGDISTICELG